MQMQTSLQQAIRELEAALTDMKKLANSEAAAVSSAARHGELTQNILPR